MREIMFYYTEIEKQRTLWIHCIKQGLKRTVLRMVLILDGSSEHITHPYENFQIYFKLDTTIDVKKWLKQINIPQVRIVIRATHEETLYYVMVFI